MTLQATENECAANAVAPRVALADIEASIAHRYNFTAAEAIHGLGLAVALAGKYERPAPDAIPESLYLLSVCLVVMKNGFTIIGKSAPASAANFNADLGRKLAYEDAVRQLWPLMGYALRDKLAA